MKTLQKLAALLLVLCVLPILTISGHPFTDLDSGVWYEPYVEYVCQNGLMNGIDTDSFGPSQNMNRAMVATVLYRMADTPQISGEPVPFTDAEQGAYYEKAVAWAYENGIVKGVSDTEFCPDADVLRSQLMTFIYRYAKAAGYDVSARADLTGYLDCGEIPAFAADAFSWAVAKGIVSGISGDMLAPNDTANRAQCAAILMRVDQLPDEAAEEVSVSLDVQPRELYLLVGESYQMEVSYNGTGTLVWKNAHPDIAEVSQTGNVTGLAEGTAYFNASDGVNSVTCRVVVSESPILTVNVTEGTVNVGSTYQVNYTYMGDYADLSWRSKDESVATVDENGLVTGVAAGSTFVIVTDGITSKQCKINVVKGPEIYFSDINGLFFDGVIKHLGDQLVFEARVEPYDVDQTVTVTTSDSSIIAVSIQYVGSGPDVVTLSFNAVGTATVTLTAINGAASQSYTVTVTDTYDFDPGDRKITPQEFADFTTKVMCANGFTYDRSCRWRTMFKIPKEELNYDRAVELGLELVHEWWSHTIHDCMILYLGQNYNGDYLFYKCE